jgi:23S rRNA (uracil1939-C5)-methyltransferase
MDNIEEITILGYAFGGSAFGRLADGRVCFVRNGVPEDKLKISLTKEKKNFAEGEILEVLEPSKNRITPACPYAKDCPGCSYLYTTYDVEFEWKSKFFNDFLTRNPFQSEEITILPGVKADNRFNWRNKITLSCRNGKLGYIGNDNKTQVPISQCLLAKEEINNAINNFDTNAATSNRITWRSSDKGIYCDNSNSCPEYLYTQLGELKFAVPPKGFFQINLEMASKLVNTAVEFVKESVEKDNTAYLLDLYCGVGVFSIACAAAIPGLNCRGVEIEAKSIRAAKHNARHNKTAIQCKYFASKSEDAFYDISQGLPMDKTILLLDPPRTGVEKSLIEKILKKKPAKIVYVSCGPDTLQRDLKLLSSLYKVTKGQMFDLFPCTSHFESITLLEKRA